MINAWLGIDTSNYTTSAALIFDSGRYYHAARPLPVAEKALGLRQSDALFEHVKARGEIFEELFIEFDIDYRLMAVGASTRPRDVDGSYMPVFLAGEAAARAVAASHSVPFHPFSHQQGHIAAASLSAGREDMLGKRHLAWHVSGGTTELLLIEPDEKRIITCVKIGGTTDLNAGQLVDRCGVMLGLRFPAGKALSALAEKGEPTNAKLKTNNLEFSLSGMQNKLEQLRDRGEPPENIARYALEAIYFAISRATEEALRTYPGLPLLCAGGVMGSSLIRARMENEFGAVFCPPEFSSDNALGTAALAKLSYNTNIQLKKQ